MNFPCPKCSARTDLDSTHIPEEGVSAKCPDCKTRFWIARESFARRALRKEGKSLCSYCNNELSNYLDCPTCGAMYPDICIVQLSRPVKKKQRKSSAAIGFSIRPQRQTRTFTSRPAESSSKTLLKIVGLLVVIALAGAAIGIPYLHRKAEQAYTASFLRALYGLKLATDLDFKQCEAAAASAKSTGQNVATFLTDTDKSRLNSAKGDVDKLMQLLPKTPQKFDQVNTNLARLHGIYVKSYALASAPTGTVSTYSDSILNLENEFKQAAKELKGSMPAEMAEEFKIVAGKYKELESL